MSILRIYLCYPCTLGHIYCNDLKSDQKGAGVHFQAEVWWTLTDVLWFQPRKLATLATCGPLKLCKYKREFWGDNHMISTWI